MRFLFVFATLFFSISLAAQEAHKLLRNGDKAYKEDSYPKAEINYRRALEKENSTQGNYNLGNTTYRQERYDEAIKNYETAAKKAKDRATKSKAFHNLGNAYYQKQDFEKSVDAYKESLRNNPNDLDTKRNLALSLKKMQQQQKKQQDQQKQDKKQDQQQKNQQQQEKEQQQPPQQNQQPPQDQQPPEQPKDMSKEEAEKLLEIMSQEEQKVQQKLRRGQGKKGKSGKDW